MSTINRSFGRESFESFRIFVRRRISTIFVASNTIEISETRWTNRFWQRFSDEKLIIFDHISLK